MRAKEMNARYRGRCACGAAVAVGDPIEYAGRIVGCNSCRGSDGGFYRSDPRPAKRDMTIEYCWANPRAGTPEGGYTVYEHGVYERGSVLEGRPMRTYVEHFDTVEEAKAAYPDAEAIAGSTYRSLNELMPKVAPAWFDPAAAGEVWGEDDY